MLVAPGNLTPVPPQKGPQARTLGREHLYRSQPNCPEHWVGAPDDPIHEGRGSPEGSLGCEYSPVKLWVLAWGPCPRI